MIYQNDSNEKNQNEFLHAFKELKLAKLLRASGIKKAQGSSVFQIFKFPLLLVFQGKNLYRFLNSKRGNEAVSKNTYYRFLNASTYNWRKFLLMLSTKVITAFNHLTRPERVKVLILDDSIINRNRSKAVELLARLYDHAEHKFVKGFTMLTLGWSDGYSFIPVDFSMISSGNEKNRFQNVSEAIDKRTLGFKRRVESMGKKTEVAVQMIQSALHQGIHADYVLMDTWFTNEPMIGAILKEGIDVIGMVKQLRQVYYVQGRYCRLGELRTLLPKKSGQNIIGSLIAETKNGIQVKLVFVSNRNKKSEWLTILSTDLSLTDDEIVRIYGNRWSIEVFFKASKSFMKLGTEFQGRSYDMMVSHTTIVFTRYIILEWLRRNEKDHKTFGELFFMFCDDIRDMDLTTALQSLMCLFVAQVESFSVQRIDFVKSQLQLWINSQPAFIKALFTNLSWES